MTDPKSGVILIIEDSEDDFRLIKESFQKANLSNPLFHCEDGDEGLDYLARQGKYLPPATAPRPQMILLDVNLPGTDGVTLLKELKAHPVYHPIPVIMLTGQEDDQLFAACFEAGAMDFINKPVKALVLKARVNAALSLSNYVHQLEQSETKLRELNISKDKFFSMISLDLKAPFANLLEFSESLSKGVEALDPQEIARQAHFVYSASRHLYRIMDTLLQWSSFQTGGLTFSPANLALEDLIVDLIALSFGMASKKHINLTYDLEANASVWADNKMLHSILQNLISNAIKFTNPGGEVKIQEKSQGDIAEVAVSDTGIGMSPEVLDKLFRLDLCYTTKGTAGEQGSGLGLILCKEFVEKHNGHIGVASQPHQGTTVTFTLPAV